MASQERISEHPVNNSKLTDKIKTKFFDGKWNRQVEHYAVTYAKSSLTYYWRYKLETEDEQQLRTSEINRWATAVEWHNAGASDRLIVALSQDANHLRHDPDRTQYELGVALGNLAGLLTQQLSGPSAQITHSKPKMLK